MSFIYVMFENFRPYLSVLSWIQLYDCYLFCDLLHEQDFRSKTCLFTNKYEDSCQNNWIFIPN